MDKVWKFAGGAAVVLVGLWVAQVIPNPIAKLLAMVKPKA